MRAFARVCAMSLLLVAAPLLPALAGPPPADVRTGAAAIQRVVDDLRVRLSISQEVDVTLVATNPLVVSVDPLHGRQGPFEMAFEADFAGQLDAPELRAVVAHELGHVWIFTHHPYLQTEQLANEIAMRVVSRASLERVYRKVWQRTGAKGDLAEFLGSK